MKLPAWYDHIINHALSLLSPPVCPVCKKGAGKHALPMVCPACSPSLALQPVCQTCGHLLPKIPALQLTPIHQCRACRRYSLHFNCARTIGAYQGTWKQAVLNYKGAPAYILARQFSSMGYRILRNRGFRGKWQAVTAVPPRLKNNTSSAVDLFALQVALRLKVAYQRILVFNRITKPQHTLSRKLRLQNVRKSMKLRVPMNIKGNWLVVDDIYTTGATVNECARVLKAAGAERVEVLTLARGLDWRVGLAETVHASEVPG